MTNYEICFKLNEPYSFYQNMLLKQNLNCVFECITHDIYYTKKENTYSSEITENEIKDSCIRLRQVNNRNYTIQNNLLQINKKEIKPSRLKNIEDYLFNNGYKKIIDTTKIDHHWYKEEMNSRIQLQEIKDIGLLIYYDNNAYSKYNIQKQKELLIDEINSYGFNFKYDDLCLNKLKTLYFKKEKYSK